MCICRRCCCCLCAAAVGLCSSIYAKIKGWNGVHGENTLGRCSSKCRTICCRRWLCLVGYAVWLGRCGTSHFGKLSQTIIIPVNTNSHNEDSMFGGFRHRRRKYKQGPEPTEMEKKIHCSERARAVAKNAAMQKSPRR
jgi:hypothetical protein